MKHGISVRGGDVSKKSLKQQGKLILSILSSQSDEKTKRVALDTIKSMLSAPSNLTISDCHIDSSQVHNYSVIDDSDLSDGEPEQEVEEPKGEG